MASIEDSAGQDRVAALLAARQRQAHVEEEAAREQAKARRLDARVGCADHVAGSDAEARSGMADLRGILRAVAPWLGLSDPRPVTSAAPAVTHRFTPGPASLTTVVMTDAPAWRFATDNPLRCRFTVAFAGGLRPAGPCGPRSS